MQHIQSLGNCELDHDFIYGMVNNFWNIMADIS